MSKVWREHVQYEPQQHGHARILLPVVLVVPLLLTALPLLAFLPLHY